MYTTDHIFPVLPIKDIINEDGDPTTPHKLERGTKPSMSHVHVLFFPCVVRKATEHVDTQFGWWDLERILADAGTQFTSTEFKE